MITTEMLFHPTFTPFGWTSDHLPALVFIERTKVKPGYLYFAAGLGSWKVVGFSRGFLVVVFSEIPLVYLQKNTSRCFKGPMWQEHYPQETGLKPETVPVFVSANLLRFHLGGGFKYVLFSPLPGEMIQFD